MFRLRVLAVLLLAAVTVLPTHRAGAQTAPAHAPAADAPRNVILFIADGCGPASFTMARDYLRFLGDSTGLALDSIQTGSVATYSTTSRVTDSAAAGTALACGIKTYNGAIAVDTLEQPVKTILEAAEERGLATGLVSTAGITHATPASFSAHVRSRGMETEIAVQQIHQGIEVLFGGARRNYLPTSEDGGARKDGRNVLDEAAAIGYQVIRTAPELRAGVQTPVIGLFAEDQLPYEIDRDTALVPSLAEMTRAAIDLLKDDPDGFFLMVEGGRIDHAAHANDPATHLHEVLAYNAAVQEALAFAKEMGSTLVVATSDHETGGLTLGRDVDGKAIYEWEPSVLQPVRGSLETMSAQYVAQKMRLDDAVRAFAGVEALDDRERTLFEPLDSTGVVRSRAAFERGIREVVSRRARVGWTSGGHTAVDVNLYAYGPGSELFVGHFENTHVARGIAALMGFQLDVPLRTSSISRTSP